MSNVIVDLLAKSPIKPIQEHMHKAFECIELLGEFLRASSASDWDKATELQSKIVAAENEADEIKNSIRSNLPKSVWMPFARSDVIEMLTIQDRLANKAKDIAGLMLGRQILFPESMADSVHQLYQLSKDAAAKAKAAIGEMDEIMESGFSGTESNFVQKLLDELNDIENQNDAAQIELRAHLMGLENDLPPVNVMFLYRLIDLIGDIADVSQRIGNRLLLLTSK